MPHSLTTLYLVVASRRTSRAVFDSAEVRAGLKECCKSVANHSALDLLDRLRAEVRVAELGMLRRSRRTIRRRLG